MSGTQDTERPSAERLRELYWDEQMSRQEIAERIGVSYGTVRRWMAEDDIETRDIGVERYSDEDLLSWIEAAAEGLGYIPGYTRIQRSEWPGPSASTYERRFGSWRDAVNEAGYKVSDHKYDANGKMIEVDPAEEIE